jgi:hypothetical protein
MITCQVRNQPPQRQMEGEKQPNGMSEIGQKMPIEG